jgi:Pentapeptide repeats (8 copies)
LSVIVFIGILAAVLGATAVVIFVIPRHTRRQLEGKAAAEGEAGRGATAYEEFSAITELRRVFVEAVVAFLLLIGAIVAFNEYRTTKERQDSERFAQIVELLGSPDITIKIGAVYGLEGVARSDKSYYPIADDTLSALIRSRVPYGERTTTPKPSGERVDPVVQAAIRVLGRVPHRPDRNLDLSRSDLHGIDFLGGDFRDTSFAKSNLHKTKTDGADFRGADFTNAAVATELCPARLGDNPGLPPRAATPGSLKCP